MNNQLLEDEIKWVRDNQHKYDSQLHMESVISNIEKRYRIKELETAIHKTQDPKYNIQGTSLINSHSGKAIPVDEPVFVFRAKDINAIDTLKFYVKKCRDVSHREVINLRIEHFETFKDLNPSILKEADT